MANNEGKYADRAETLLELASEIVAAYVSNNAISTADVAGLLKTVYATLGQLSDGNSVQIATREPAVPIKQSITPDYIICLEDGKKLKMLKRYLRTHFGMTPDQYRTKWGLPPDYPIVAPNYSKRRSDFAKKIGLGRAAGAPVKGRGRGRKRRA